MGFFLFFVYLLFPIPAIVLALLLIPFPVSIKQKIIRFADFILFVNVHPAVPGLSLFWLCFLVSMITLTHCVNGYLASDNMVWSIGFECTLKEN